MAAGPLRLELVEGDYAVCRLEHGADPGAPQPAPNSLYSVTWTSEETSVVCLRDQAPAGSKQEGPFAVLRVAGTLEFSLTGVLADLTRALADAEVSVFALSTHDTDYLLVPKDGLSSAAEALREAGHEVAS